MKSMIEKLQSIKGVNIDFEVDGGIVNRFRLRSNLSINKHFVILLLKPDTEYYNIHNLLYSLGQTFGINNIFLFDNDGIKVLLGISICSWHLYKRILLHFNCIEKSFKIQSIKDKFGYVYVDTYDNGSMYYLGNMIYESRPKKGLSDYKLIADSIFNLIKNPNYV